MSTPSVPSGINGDQVLADFQACTGIDDIAVALIHLQESEWDLLRAVNRVIPDNSQALPSAEGSAGSGFGRVFSNSLLMDQDGDPDIQQMDEDVIPTTVAPSEINNGENHASTAFSSTAKKSSTSSAAERSRNDMNHVGASGSSSSSDSKFKPDRMSKYSGKSHGLPPRVTLSADFLEAGPSRSAGSDADSKREINFLVHYNGQILPMTLAQCETVDTLKTLVHAQTDVPPCQQIISGWPTNEPSSNNTRFGSLNLPNEVHLQLTTASSNLSGLNIPRNEEEDDRYQLHVRDDTNKESYTIGFDGSKTVRGVKEDFSSICEIPVRLQAWSGWPVSVSDTMTLNVCGLNKPVHNLTLRKQTSAQSSSTEVNKKNDGMDATDGSESSDVEDLTESYPIEEEFFIPERNTSSVRHLISDNVIDEVVGTIQFSENFAGRYGACHPMFFHGMLDDAVKEACIRPAKERKLLAMYLHHDGSVMSNVFCQQVLCNESVVSYMTNNFVTWGWDVTNETNRGMLISAVSRTFGPPGVSTIRSLDREKYPVIIIVSRVRSATEISHVLSGSRYATVDELMGTLMQAVDMFQSQQRADIREEEEREAREQVKREQDEAYQLSLAADRAKDESKRMFEQQKKQEEIAKREAEEREQRERDEVAKGLPQEPGADCTESVCVLKCRLPGGKIVSRRFLHSSTLKILFDFLFSQGFSKDKYKFLTSYPKRDLTTMPDSAEMKGVFSAQDTLIVEER